MNKEALKIKVESFSGLRKNWGGYNEDEVAITSIITAHKVIDSLPNTACDVNVFPMRDGGIQIEVGDFHEIEIIGRSVTQINYNRNHNIINKYIYELQ